MNFTDFENYFSRDRVSRYLGACNGDKRKAMTLYRENLRLSQEMFTILSCFEVTLRNRIDMKLIGQLGEDWLRDSIMSGGIFTGNSFNATYRIVSNVYHQLIRDNAYSHNKLLSGMEFGVWKYMFSNPQYRATGRVLLDIFPEKPVSTPDIQYNNVFFFNELHGINLLRNRIAHHEPICFSLNERVVDVSHTEAIYNRIVKLFEWMAIDYRSMLYGLDHVALLSERIRNM